MSWLLPERASRCAEPRAVRVVAVLPVGWLVVAVVAAILLTMWITFTLTRLDRLHARVDAAQAALDAQLVRRAAALQHVAESSNNGLPDELARRYDEAALDALAMLHGDRRAAENAVGRAIAEIADQQLRVPAQSQAELAEASSRVLIARRFYNDAVRDTRTLRMRRMPRLLRLAGRREMPHFFDIDDTVPAFDVPRAETATAPTSPENIPEATDSA